MEDVDFRDLCKSWEGEQLPGSAWDTLNHLYCYMLFVKRTANAGRRCIETRPFDHLKNGQMMDVVFLKIMISVCISCFQMRSKIVLPFIFTLLPYGLWTWHGITKDRPCSFFTDSFENEHVKRNCSQRHIL
jgi:hypothetical protein